MNHPSELVLAVIALAAAGWMHWRRHPWPALAMFFVGVLAFSQAVTP